MRFTRGEDVLKQFAQSKTIETGNTMTDHFCSNCGMSCLVFQSSCVLGMVTEWFIMRIA
jgi:hypothetical protein